MLLDYFSLAWKSLIHKKLRSWLTIIGILIGVMAVVSLISLGEGLKTAITSQFGISSTELISVQAGGLSGYGPPGTGVVNPLTVDDIEEIEKIDGVDVVLRRNIPSGKLEFNDVVGFGYAINIPSGDERKIAYDILDVEAEEGRLLKDVDIGKVMLGYNFKDKENGFDKSIKVGDTVLLQDKKFEVVGIIEKQGSFIFDNMVYMEEDELSDLFDIGDDVDVIAVKVKDKSLVESVSHDIEKLMRKRRDVKEGEEDFEVSTPAQALENVNTILTGVQIFIIIIASISILVGAIGIVNTMTTSVLERKKEIGIMKSIGSRNEDIFYQFLIESGLMGMAGGLVGTIFGVLIGYFGTAGLNNWIGAEATPEINIWLIIFTLLGSFLIGSIAGIIPAMNAAKQNPVDALRG